MRLRQLALRLLFLAVTVPGICFFSFAIMEMAPGSPEEMLIMQAGIGRDPTAVAELRAKLGLDRPWWERFGLWLAGAARGDLGRSVTTGESVGRMVAKRLPATLELTFTAWLLALAGALPMGALAALRRGGWTDGLLRALALTQVSLPGFVLGLGLLWVFGFWLGWVPVLGGGVLRGLWLPALCLAAAMTGVYSRMVRERFLEVLGQDYILLARAKGLGPWAVLRRHVLKNALIPLTTLWGMSLGYLLGGAVVIEVIFSWPGVGVLAVRAIADRDYPVIQAYVLLVALCFTLINLAVDLGYLFLDPRVRRRGLLRNG